MAANFGKASGGGQRSCPRTQIPLPVTLRSITSTRCVALVDISETGARFEGKDLPKAGEDVDVTIGSVEIFGNVAWSSQSQCGVGFYDPLGAADIAQLRRKVVASNGRWVTVDERLALEQWLHGVSA